MRIRSRDRPKFTGKIQSMPQDCSQPQFHAFRLLRPLVNRSPPGRIGKWVNLMPEKFARMLVRQVKVRFQPWLLPSQQSSSIQAAVIRGPIPDCRMLLWRPSLTLGWGRSYPVSSRVGEVANDDEACSRTPLSEGGVAGVVRILPLW